MRFSNEVVVITGASSGIGWALAKELVTQGAKVGLIARRADKLEDLCEQSRANGGVAECVAVDVSDREKLHEAIAELRNKLGPIDRMIANAGIGTFTSFSPPNVLEQEKLIRINFFGVMYALEAVLPEMLERKKGHVIAVSSMAAYKGLPGQSAYCASKAAINLYMEGLRIAYRGKGVSVTTICPGFVDTPIVANNPPNMPFIMKPEMAARRIAKAIARRKKVYNFPRRMAFLMWLARWAPDWAVSRVMRSDARVEAMLSERAE